MTHDPHTPEKSSPGIPRTRELPRDQQTRKFPRERHRREKAHTERVREEEQGEGVPPDPQERSLRQRYDVGDDVHLCRVAAEHYADLLSDRFATPEELLDRSFRITHVATKHGEPGGPEGTHPGYDPTGNAALYDLEDLPCSLYDYELK